METRPDGIDDVAVKQALADGWGFDAVVVDYAPVGFGSYHWIVAGASGGRRFVTVDDPDDKLWLGGTREERLAGLRRAFDTAVALRNAGLELVVAPLPGGDGATLRPLGPRHTVALFPFVEGRSARGPYESAAERASVLDLLVELHDATPLVRDVASRHSLAVPGRTELDAALRDRDTPWHGGPFSEPARRALGPRAADLMDAMARFDDLASQLGGDEGWVVSHGEPHSANVMRTGERLVLVDWDTVALAPPERDLWMVADSPADAASYTEATGRHVDARALALFRAAWDLGDLAAYVSLFRAPHREDADTAKAFGGVTKILARLGR